MFTTYVKCIFLYIDSTQLTVSQQQCLEAVCTAFYQNQSTDVESKVVRTY